LLHRIGYYALYKLGPQRDIKAGKYWKMQVWKIEVQKGKMCKGGKYKYGKIKYDCVRAENASTEKASTSEHDQYYSTYSVLYRLVGRLGFGSKD